MEKEKKPLYKKWWFWVIIVVVVVVIAAAASGGSSKQPSGPSAQSAAPSTQNSAPVSTETPPTEEPSEAPSNVFHAGDTLEAGDLNITYQECDPNWTGYNQYLGPQEGNKIIRAYFILENTGKGDKTCGSAEFSCYADGSACQAFYFSGDNDLPALETISSGRNVKGYIYFEVPEDAEFIELEYELNLWTSEKAIFIVE